MPNVQTYIDQLQAQLASEIVTTPVNIRIRRNAITLSFIPPNNHFLEISVELIGPQVLMVIRNYKEENEKNAPLVTELWSFADNPLGGGKHPAPVDLWDRHEFTAEEQEAFMIAFNRFLNSPAAMERIELIPSGPIPVADPEHLRRACRAYRKQHQITLNGMAKLVGIHANTIRRLELGKGELNVYTYNQISKFLNK